ncbi:lamin tail domain-containing protein [Myxococcus sp. K15C18031901]|uniref:lamin tail domain-containing protein n=1 Tax=Myxococcus dinghuensis TaxID=2906761 RepID=UPI0020A75410|nr:lamin tail domain-containing protein [Myxococcus dinghuensis]MCP3100680.1 lamin tail domain-containing protein [Myxococcus dinghuensis]
MNLVRLTATLAVLVLWSACSGSNHESPGGGPRLPTDASLTDTTVGATYETRLGATGGTAPLRYGIQGEVPPGFSFYPSEGRLVGPASASGEFSVTVDVRDVENSRDTRTYSLKVWPAPVLAPQAPPAGAVGNGYTHTFGVTGGRPPLTFSLADGALPSGLALSQDGEVAGVAEVAGTQTFTVRVEDASGVRVEGRYSLEVKPNTGTPDSGPSTTFPLSVGNWNIEWFGDPVEGPADDAKQLENVTAVLLSANKDIWGLAEVVNTDQFNTLKAQLPGYDGFLANDSRVTLGSAYYSTNEQKLGVLFKSNIVQVLSAQVILSEYNSEFAGRPPLRVDLRITRGTAKVDLTLIVVHLKAQATTPDFEQRVQEGQLLKAYLDANLPTQRVMVVGDWNDDVDQSTTTNPSTGAKYDTPFRPIVNDTARYTYITQALSLANVGSTVGRNTFIDHQLASNEMFDAYVANSAEVIRPSITSYSSTTSDHYPIVSRYDFGQVSSGPLRLTAPNGGEALTAGAAFDITWAATDVTTVKLEYSTDDGVTWQPITASTSAASGRYPWTVPSEVSTQARVRITDTARPTVTDTSDGVFQLKGGTSTVFINEYLPQPFPPAGSTTPDYDKMFVEILNASGTVVDLSNWKLHDDESKSGAKPPRHVFPQGTTLQPGKVYTVFSGAAAVPVGMPNASSASSPDGLRFNRANDGVYLLRADDSVADSASYGSTTQGTSFNRNPDGNAVGNWVAHTTMSTNPSSPGTRVDGSAF